jgi:UDP-N-acetylglucosamine 2-epimerase (non-hydrolysing)
LVGRDPQKLRAELSRVLSGKAKSGSVPPLWDGHAGERIADIVVSQSQAPGATGPQQNY